MIFRIIKSNYGGDWRMILVQVLAFLGALYFAIVLHEVAHGVVALWNGDDTAKVRGRLTLDPIKHVDPLGAVMMLVIGIGWAKPVPINPAAFRNYRRGLVTVSMAGIIMNLILAATSLGLMAALCAILRVATLTNAFGYYTGLFFLYLFAFSAILNVSLAGFNFLPLFPLDGFRLIEALTPPNNGYVRFMRRYGIFIYFALIGLGILEDITGWPCDILGRYISVIQSGVYRLIDLIMGG